ncbi:MAG: alpha/beta hydrolase [Prevotella sp.]|nr:alpha/beta hydrolase [Prevotella sp.]
MKRLKISLLALLLPTLAICGKSLSKTEVESFRQQLIAEWKTATEQRLQTAWDRNIIEVNNLEMPIWKAVYGEKPQDGRSLWISLHGGGNTHPLANDQQWDNQKRLYRPAEGVYVAPRAPYNDWNMWCKEALDTLYSQLIELCVVRLDVNPDKVYILGYSAGGDGVWRMAPRMADTWAAASMMAGHPGDVSLLNLRNTPFMIWCGAEDAAYDRNKLDRERGLQMDSLQNADPEGYIHETHIMEGMGHWMLRADTVAVPWMAKYKRNPYPRTIVWQQEEVLRKHFYWISAPQHELKRGKTVRLTCQDNTIDISACDYSSLTLWVNDELVDLDQKVTVSYQGKKLFCKRLERSEENMRQSLSERNDLSYIFPAKITIKLK